MGKIKIAFFDIDGTLIDFHAHRPSPKTLETLARLKANGIAICLATGRSPLVLPHFPGIEFDAFLTFNGSYCFDSDRVLFSNPIPQEDIRQLLKNAAGINRPVCIATPNRLAANGTDTDLADYFRIAGLEVEIAKDFDRLLQEKIYQVMMGCYESEYPSVMNCVHHAKIAAWWDRAVDIIPLNGGKGVAITKILDYYQLTKEEAMAFGDGNNDIEMLEAVGRGVAMKNASLELKSIADDICDDVANDGIYSYCKAIGLI